jgi:hypothetical protein
MKRKGNKMSLTTFNIEKTTVTFGKTKKTPKEYKVCNKTYYDPETSDDMIQLLEHIRNTQIRCAFHYGNTSTGQAWGDIETGKLSRTTGPVKTKYRGPALLTNCIVKIVGTNPKKKIYQHPNFKPAN